MFDVLDLDTTEDADVGVWEKKIGPGEITYNQQWFVSGGAYQTEVNNIKIDWIFQNLTFILQWDYKFLKPVFDADCEGGHLVVSNDTPVFIPDVVRTYHMKNSVHSTNDVA